VKILLLSVLVVAMIGVMVPSVEGLTDEEWKEVIRKAEIEHEARMSSEDLKTKFSELEFLHEELQKRIMEQTHHLTYDAVNEHGNAGAGIDIVADKFAKSWDHLFEAENYWFESDGLLIFASVQVKNYSVDAENTLNEIEQALTKVRQSLITSERLWLEGKNYVHPNMNSDGTVPLWIPKQKISSDEIKPKFEILIKPNFVHDDGGYYREDHRFVIKHLDWEIRDSFDATHYGYESTFGHMDPIVTFVKGYDGAVQILHQTNNSQTMVDSIPKEELKNMMIEEVENFCKRYIDLTCVEIIPIDGSGRTNTLGTLYGEPTIVTEFAFNILLKFETGEEMNLLVWYRLWNDPYDGTMMLAMAVTNCDPTASEKIKENTSLAEKANQLSCKQVPNQTAKFEPETLEIIGSLNTLPIKYNNEKYGFTFTYPQGTVKEYFDDIIIKIPVQSGPPLEVVALYTYEDSNAIILPHMKIFAVDFETDVSDENLKIDESSAKEMARGFLDGLATQGMEGELLSSNTDKITDGMHMELKSNMEIEATFEDGLSETISVKMDAHSWILKDGVVIWYLYVAEPSDYNRYLSEYRNSVNSFAFEPRVVNNSEGGGCLIATAAYGSEMAPQVQFLRELRDNTVLQTTSGIAFMTGFNQFYYSFSPQIADYERENPAFKEAVKVTLTPLLTSLTLLNYVQVDTEEEMLGYGIGIILLNIGMYFVAPAVLIVSLKKRLFL